MANDNALPITRAERFLNSLSFEDREAFYRIKDLGEFREWSQNRPDVESPDLLWKELGEFTASQGLLPNLPEEVEEQATQPEETTSHRRVVHYHPPVEEETETDEASTKQTVVGQQPKKPTETEEIFVPVQEPGQSTVVTEQRTSPAIASQARTGGYPNRRRGGFLNRTNRLAARAARARRPRPSLRHKAVRSAEKKIAFSALPLLGALIPLLLGIIVFVAIVGSLCTVPGLNFIVSALGMPCSQTTAIAPPPTQICENNGGTCKTSCSANEAENTSLTCSTTGTCCLPNSNPGPGPIPDCDLIDTALQNQMGVIVGGTSASCEAKKAIYKNYAKLITSPLYKKYLTTGPQFRINIYPQDQANRCHGGTSDYTITMYGFTQCLGANDESLFLVHETGHVLRNKHPREIKDPFAAKHSDLVRQDGASCYDREYVKSYSLRLGVDCGYGRTTGISSDSESLAEGSALYLLHTRTLVSGCGKPIYSFKSVCPRTYDYLRTLLFGGVEF